MSKPDQIYARPRGHLVDFTFDDAVADVFPDMIRRSVPGYDSVVLLTAALFNCRVRKRNPFTAFCAMKMSPARESGRKGRTLQMVLQ